MRVKYLLGIVLMMLCASALAGAGEQYKRPGNDVIKKRLTTIQYQVTQEKGTEPAYHNAYWDNKKPGIYVDIVSGEPLFSSTDKYDSGTGWPSFTKPLEPNNIVYMRDDDLVITRTEVISKHGLSHLGHVFDDGPLPTGKRYCMNSAALKFIPVDEMKKNGYQKYLYLFEDNRIQNAANNEHNSNGISR